MQGSPPPLRLSEAASCFSARRIYLDTANTGLPPAVVTQALIDSVDRWGCGELDAAGVEANVARARSLFARLIGVPAEDVAIDSAVSNLVGLVATAVPLGARVLCAEEDFASLLFPFLRRQQSEEIIVKTVPLSALVDSIDAHTTLVAVSAVQSSDGRMLDRAALLQACRHFGVRSLIDATQAVGWLPFAAGEFDYVVVNSYKWLFGPRGCAFLYVRQPDAFELQPSGPGWYAGADIPNSLYGPPLRLAASARRFDMAPSSIPWIGCAAALEFVSRLDIGEVYAHNMRLASLFLERVGVAKQPSAIISLAGTRVADALRASDVTVTSRSGATRLSFHLFNSEEQVAHAADVARAAR